MPLITTKIDALSREQFEKLSLAATQTPREKLGQHPRIKLDVVDTEDDLYYEMVRVLVALLRTDQKRGKVTVWVVPVGPVGQFRRLARYRSEEHTSELQSRGLISYA